MKFIIACTLLISLLGCNSVKESMTKGGIDMASNKDKTKLGCSGYGFFIEDQLAKLRLAKTPYTGSTASSDFRKEWEALTPAEREKYNRPCPQK
jgi:hypothetical protein